MTIKSGNHSDAFKDADGLWVCHACDSESMDFELFEESGAMSGCIPAEEEPYVPPQVRQDVYLDVMRARDWLNESGEMKTMDGKTIGTWPVLDV